MEITEFASFQAGSCRIPTSLKLTTVDLLVMELWFNPNSNPTFSLLSHFVEVCSRVVKGVGGGQRLLLAASRRDQQSCSPDKANQVNLVRVY